MTFGVAVTHCLRYNYVNFSGRARRSEFWFLFLFNLLTTLAFAVLQATARGISDGLFGLIVFLDVLTSLAVLLPTLAVLVRRLHDTGRSAWWLLLPLAAAVTIAVGTVVYQVSLVRSARAHGHVALDAAGRLVLVPGAGDASTGAVVFLVATSLAYLAGMITFLVFLVTDSGPANKYGVSPKEFIYGLPPELGPLAPRPYAYSTAAPAPAAPWSTAAPAQVAPTPPKAEERYLIGDYGSADHEPRHRQDSGEPPSPWSSPL